MARPRKQTVDYFPHDTDASEKKTLTILQGKYGNDGYAFWFKLLELLGKSPGHYIRYENPVEWEFLLAKTHVPEDKALEILETLTVVGAIDKELYEHKCIWSQNFVDRLLDVYERRSILPQKPSFGKHIDSNNRVSVSNNSVSTNNNPQTKQNKTKLNKTKEGSSQLPDEVEELVSEFLKLPSWGNSQLANDEEWLSEFLADFPKFSILHLKACRDYHLAKSTKHTKGAWKSRFRNWMTKEANWNAKGKSRELPKNYTPQRNYED